MNPRTRTILFFDQFGQIGGGQRILIDLALTALKREWKVIVLCPEGPLARALKERGVEVHPLPVPPMRSGRKSCADVIRGYLFSRRAAAEYAELGRQCDLIVVNGLRTMGIAKQWVRSYGKPAALYLHSVFRGFPRWLVSSFLKLPQTVAIAPSSPVAEPFQSLPNVRIVPNWVSQDFLSPEIHADELRKTLGITDALP
ncbi:MAG: glycosyltransferase family 4 protein, partial [Candidatus Peribacteraceae bacterium]|nr:glycosyltransferase family 4 protein [Candidatus Peribacteraceae bacterium]